jgi:hypothetical protein
VKRCFVLCAAILGVVTLMLFVFSRRVATVASPGGQPTPNASRNLHVGAAGALAAQTAGSLPATVVQPPAPPRTKPTVLPGGTTVSGETIAATAAFNNFAKWAEQFSRSSANVVEGEKLAWKRREAMLDLIQTDPAGALALAAPFAWRQQLPPQVTRFFEQQLDGRGNFNVAVGTDFAQGNTTVFRNVQLGGTN